LKPFMMLLQLGSCDVGRYPRTVEDRAEGLNFFAAPANCRKLVHRWRDRQWTPDVREALNA
jgi:hypothetical protein